MKFGEKLVKLRVINGFTQDAFAKEIGVSRQSVYKWESDISYPDIIKAAEILKLYSLKLSDLVDDNIDIDDNGYAVKSEGDVHFNTNVRVKSTPHEKPAKPTENKRKFLFFGKNK